MKAFSALSLILAVAAPAAFAQQHGHGAHDGHAAHAGPEAPPETQAAQAELAEGEVRKVDKDTGKITLRHGEIRNLKMSPMTMVFRTGDAAMLEQVKAGDKVRFAAERVNGAITIVQLHAAE